MIICLFSRNEELHESPPLYDERKFVVFESCLRELFLRCFTCLSSCRVVLRRVLGTSVVIEQQCCNGHHNSWSSQRFVQQMPAGNLLLSAALFFRYKTTVLSAMEKYPQHCVHINEHDALIGCYSHINIGG